MFFIKEWHHHTSGPEQPIPSDFIPIHSLERFLNLLFNGKHPSANFLEQPHHVHFQSRLRRKLTQFSSRKNTNMFSVKPYSWNGFSHHTGEERIKSDSTRTSERNTHQCICICMIAVTRYSTFTFTGFVSQSWIGVDGLTKGKRYYPFLISLPCHLPCHTNPRSKSTNKIRE